ncbi:unnamed protein product, partial [Didymodactylos carnosus]
GKRRRIFIDFLLVTISITLLYTSFSAVSNLQASINTQKNIGLNTLTIWYGIGALSSLFLSYPLMDLISYKWTIFIGEIGFLFYIAANIYPQPWLLYPIAIIFRIVSCGLTPAKGSIVQVLSQQYAKENKNENEETRIKKFNGIFFGVYST